MWCECVIFCFLLKQKTAYELRISDWSSDVCSSDLALSFARLVYVSAWLKCHQPAVFAAALLNAQPMGFYAPAQIVRAAREKGGVEVRAIDITASDWDTGIDTTRHDGLDPASNFPQACAPVDRRAMEQVRGGTPALRLGLPETDGFRR